MAPHVMDYAKKAHLDQYAKKGISGGSKIVTGFRDFLLRGNVVDLAVAIVVGTAFTAVVKALVADIITPLIAAIYGGQDFTNLYFTVHNSKFLIGDFINACLTFFIICVVVYFIVVLPINALLNKFYPKAPKVKCPHCLEEISKGATRCKWCTSELDPESVLPAPNMGKEVPAKISKKDKAIANEKTGPPAGTGTAKAGAEPNAVPAAPASATTRTGAAPDGTTVNPARSGAAADGPATTPARTDATPTTAAPRVSTPAAGPGDARHPSENFYPGADNKV